MITTFTHGSLVKWATLALGVVRCLHRHLRFLGLRVDLWPAAPLSCRVVLVAFHESWCGCGALVSYLLLTYVELTLLVIAPFVGGKHYAIAGFMCIDVVATVPSLRRWHGTVICWHCWCVYRDMLTAN